MLTLYASGVFLSLNHYSCSLSKITKTKALTGIEKHNCNISLPMSLDLFPFCHTVYCKVLLIVVNALNGSSKDTEPLELLLCICKKTNNKKNSCLVLLQSLSLCFVYNFTFQTTHFSNCLKVSCLFICHLTFYFIYILDSKMEISLK